MIKAILLTLAVIFAVLGLCDIIYAVKSAFLFPGVKTNGYFVLRLKKGFALQQLKYYAEKKRWYGNEFCDKIIAITDDLDNSEKSSCDNYISRSDILLCDIYGAIYHLNGFGFGEVDGRKDF